VKPCAISAGDIEAPGFIESLPGPFDYIVLVDTLGSLDDCRKSPVFATDCCCCAWCGLRFCALKRLKLDAIIHTPERILQSAANLASPRLEPPTA
jgi:hypothetical protein